MKSSPETKTDLSSSASSREPEDNLLIKDGLLLLWEGEELRAVEGHLFIRGSVIEKVITDPAAPIPDAINVIQARGKLVIPGLINGHTHSYAGFMRIPYANARLEAWVEPVAERRTGLSDEILYLAALLTSIQALESGTTTLLDHVTPIPQGTDAAARAYLDIGIRALVAPLVADRPFADVMRLLEDSKAIVRNPPANVTEFQVTHTQEAFSRWHQVEEERIQILAGPSNVHLCSDNLWVSLGELAAKYGSTVHTHFLETLMQRYAAYCLYGTSAAEHLQSLGLLDIGCSFAHAVWLERIDEQILAEKETGVIHNPMSNLMFGGGIAPWTRYCKAGIPVGLGTDGCNCGGSQVMFDSMKLAVALQRNILYEESDWPLPSQALELATVGNAQALGLSHLVGTLEPGKQADVVILGTGSPSLTPLYNPVEQLVLGDCQTLIETVLVDGRVVVSEGRVTTVDRNVVFDEVQEIASQQRLKVTNETDHSSVISAVQDWYRANFSAQRTA